MRELSQEGQRQEVEQQWRLTVIAVKNSWEMVRNMYVHVTGQSHKEYSLVKVEQTTIRPD